MKKNSANIQITRRDVDMLNWINGQGFVDVNHIVTRYKMSPSTAYSRLRKLAAHNFLKHERLLINKPGHYCPFISPENRKS